MTAEMVVVTGAIGAAASYLAWQAWRVWRGRSGGCGQCACNKTSPARSEHEPGLIPPETITVKARHARG
jgi:hypothetical protein